jgi:hypothetical protein
MELFEAPGYSLLVRPAGEMQGEIVAVRPERESEMVTPNDPSAWQSGNRVRGARAVITWESRPLPTLDRARNVGAYVYIIAKGKLPVYVGQTGNFSNEWSGRFRILRALGAPLENYVIHLGKVAAEPGLLVKDTTAAAPRPFVGTREADVRLLRQDVEHLLIRSLANMRINVANELSTRQIRSARIGVTIRHAGAVPAFLQQGFTEVGPNVATNMQAAGGWTTTVQPNAVFETPWG